MTRPAPRRPGAAAAALLAVLAAGTALPGSALAADECPRWRAAFAGMPLARMSLETPRGRRTLRVRLAAEAEQAAAGFQCATPEEIRDTLVLFDFGTEILTRFHMRNVPAPLDIAFAKADGRIFAILRMEAESPYLYGPPGPFRYALEARAGFFAGHGVAAGTSRLEVLRR